MQRRHFLRTSTAFAVGAAAGLRLRPAIAQEGGTLRLLTWEGYADDAWVKNFEDAHGVQVAKTYVGSNDEYMAKLAAGGGDYDLVVIVSSLGRRAINAGFVEPLDLSLIPNFQSIYPRLQSGGFIRKDDQVFGAPTFVAISPITVNTEVIPEGNDFGLLFDERFAGRIAMWDDVSTLGDVAAWMGIEDVWNMSDDQLEAVKQKLIEQKPMVRTYWSQAGEAIDLFMNGEVVISNSWSYITSELKARGLPVREFYGSPPSAAVDSHFIVSGTPSRELAHAFIDHILSPQSQGAIAEISGYTPSNPQSVDFMPAETWKTMGLDAVGEVVERMNIWEDIPRRSRYLEVLSEVKAA